jgi:anti-sigma28 factor (negative regulator of flagellin synthesis)
MVDSLSIIRKMTEEKPDFSLETKHMRIDRINVGQVMDPKVRPSLKSIHGDKEDTHEVIVSPELQQKLDRALQQATANTERLNDLWAMVQEGSYKIDFDKLVVKMLDEDLFTK